MMHTKVFLLVVILCSVTAKSNERSWARRIFEELDKDASASYQTRGHELDDDDKISQELLKDRRNYLEKDDDISQELPKNRRNHLEKDMEDAEEINSNRRSEDEDLEEEYLELRATVGSKSTDTGPVITLQNRAIMNTRLRVLYTNENCSPFLAETGLLWIFQTKSITLPTNAKNVKIIVEKDIFAGNWRLAYNGTLTETNKCIRITGITLKSHIKPCK